MNHYSFTSERGVKVYWERKLIFCSIVMCVQCLICIRRATSNEGNERMRGYMLLF